MKLKGTYDSSLTYDVGDVVRNEDGVIYVLQKAAPAGTDPKDTLYWGRVTSPVAEAASFAIDAMAIAATNSEATAAAEVEKYFINDQTLLLKAGEGEDEKTYAVTVDASGDTPELAVEEVSEEEESDGE